MNGEQAVCWEWTAWREETVRTVASQGPFTAFCLGRVEGDRLLTAYLVESPRGVFRCPSHGTAVLLVASLHRLHEIGAAIGEPNAELIRLARRGRQGREWKVMFDDRRLVDVPIREEASFLRCCLIAWANDAVRIPAGVVLIERVCEQEAAA